MKNVYIYITLPLCGYVGIVYFSLTNSFDTGVRKSIELVTPNLITYPFPSWYKAFKEFTNKFVLKQETQNILIKLKAIYSPFSAYPGQSCAARQHHHFCTLCHFLA